MRQQYRKPYFPNSSNSSHRAKLYNNASTRKENSLQVWMGDLSPTWTEEFIFNLWTKLVSRPVQVKIIKDRFNPSKPSYCFVTFDSQESLELAVQRNGQRIPDTNKTFKLNHATGNKSLDSNGTEQQQQQFTLFAGDLAMEVNEATLFAKFNLKYPNQISSAKVITDPNTRKSRGFGFVKFNTAEFMNKALNEMQGMIIGSKAIRLGIAAGSDTSTTTQQPSTKTDYHKISLPQHQPELNKWTDGRNTNIILTGLSSKFTRSELEILLLPFGDIIYLNLNQSFENCYCKYLYRESAEQAYLHLNGLFINGSRIKVLWGSSVAVKNGETNFKPKLNESKYEPDTNTPMTYIANYYDNSRLDLLDEKEKGEYFKRLDGSEPRSVNQINSVYLKQKSRQHELLNSSLF